MDATITQAQPTPQNITKAVYDYISTLRPGEELTSSDIHLAIKATEPNVRISNVAAAMFHLRNEGVIEVIGTTRPSAGVGRAYKYKIIKADTYGEHTFRSGYTPSTKPRGPRRTRVEMANVRAGNIEAAARHQATTILEEARNHASNLISNDLPISLMLANLSGRAGTLERELETLVANAKVEATKPSGRLLSEASLPEIIAEMARRM